VERKKSAKKLSIVGRAKKPMNPVAVAAMVASWSALTAAALSWAALTTSVYAMRTAGTRVGARAASIMPEAELSVSKIATDLLIAGRADGC
jgi:hypothetical protein